MKRTFTANISGKVYNIDDDAFALLQNYLTQLRQTFGPDDADEIVADIESRIGEILDERTDGGVKIIGIQEINRVIETMGRPQDLGTDAPGPTPPPVPEVQKEKVRKELFRNLQNHVFGGVLGGVATYLGWNANVMRVLYVVLALFPGIPTFWPCIFIYLIAWMIIPAATTPAQVLKMNGEPVSLDSLGRQVIEDATPEPLVNRSFWSTLFSASGKVVMAIAGILGVLVAISSGLLLSAVAVGIVAFLAYGNTIIIDSLPGVGPEAFPLAYAYCMAVWLAFALLASIAVSWCSACVVLHAAPASKVMRWTAFALMLVLLSAGIILGIVCDAL